MSRNTRNKRRFDLHYKEDLYKKCVSICDKNLEWANSSTNILWYIEFCDLLFSDKDAVRKNILQNF